MDDWDLFRRARGGEKMKHIMLGRHVAVLRAAKLCKYKLLHSNRLWYGTITVFTRGHERYFVNGRFKSWR